MLSDYWLQRAGEAELSVAQLVNSLMGAVGDDGNRKKQLTKQLQVLISEALDNEMDKIAKESRKFDS